MAYQHVQEPQPPSVYDPELRPEYDAIVLKALAKERENRYQSADEMRADIERALDGLPVAAAQSVGYGAGAAMGGYEQQTQVYGGQPDAYGRTTAMPQQTASGYGQTSLLPGVGKGYDAGGDGYDDNNGYDNGYDDGSGYNGRGDRRRNAGGGGRSRSTSWIILGIAAVLVLAGSYFVAKSMFGTTAKNTYAAPPLIGQDWNTAQTSVGNVQGNLKVVQGAPVACSTDTASKGDVCTQSPVSGTTMQEGGTITVHLSSGAPTKAVPSVTNQTTANATTAINGAGFTLGSVTQASSPTVPSGNVISQSPAAGSQAALNSPVNLVVSSGQAQVTLTGSLVGDDGSAAASTLKGLGLTTLTTISPTYNTSYNPGAVIAETYNGSPVTGGTQVPAGASVNLTVNPPTNPDTQPSPSTSTPTDPNNPGNPGNPGNGGNNGWPGGNNGD